MTLAVRRWAWRSGAPVRAVLVGLIWLYRVTVGQLVGGQCRFYPSCSGYAEAAIRQAGWLRGSVLALWRVLRCNPWSAGGIDYPPRRRAGGSYDVVNARVYDAIVPSPSRSVSSQSRADVEAWTTDAAEVSR